ncbi:MAG: prepilin-type N-terminal cleavage/methylation domain-containing protein [Myxococcota bacterium]
MRARAAHGFTLLEVLVAIFIMSLVITFAFQAYRGIAEAFTRVSEVTSRDRAARVLLDRIERELTGAVMVQREEGADPLTHPYLFFAEPRTYDDSNGFELRFITQTPLRSPFAPPVALALVTYGVVQSQNGTGLALLRQEEPVPAFLAKQVEWTNAQTLAENVAIFELGFAGEGVQPTGGWDSTGVAQLDALPETVDVSISLWETSPEGHPWPGKQFVRRVQIPVRPFRLVADDASGEASADCRGGTTVAACVSQFANQIREASPSLAAAINDALSQTRDACWNEPQPSEALDRLKVLMGGLPGFDASACQ